LKFRRYALSLIFLTFISAEAGADVFSLWPFSRKSSSSISGEEIPEQRKLWDEPVEINGINLNLTLSIIDTEMMELIARMKKMKPAPRIHPGPDYVLIIIPLKNGMVRKILLVQLAPGTPSMLFTMETPEKIPSTFTWPQALPLPSGAETVNYMYFPERNSYFGSFMVDANNSSLASNDIKASLESSGWKALGQQRGEAETEGDVFVRDNPPGMAISAFSPENKDGKSRGSIYMRPIK